MIRIIISTDNAAFEEESYGIETARILRELADRYEEGLTPNSARDINGNRCVNIEYEKD